MFPARDYPGPSQFFCCWFQEVMIRCDNWGAFVCCCQRSDSVTDSAGGFFVFFVFSDLQFVRRPLLLMSMSFVYPFLVKLKINPARFEPHSSRVEESPDSILILRHLAPSRICSLRSPVRHQFAIRSPLKHAIFRGTARGYGGLAPESGSNSWR